MECLASSLFKEVNKKQSLWIGCKDHFWNLYATSVMTHSCLAAANPALEREALSGILLCSVGHHQEQDRVRGESSNASKFAIRLL